jgi:hypothetical protein
MLPVVTALTLPMVADPAAAATDQPVSTKSKRDGQRTQTSVPSQGIRPYRNSCEYDRAAGGCVIDLGNGRCLDCSAGGPMK